MGTGPWLLQLVTRLQTVRLFAGYARQPGKVVEQQRAHEERGSDLEEQAPSSGCAVVRWWHLHTWACRQGLRTLEEIG